MRNIHYKRNSEEHVLPVNRALLLTELSVTITFNNEITCRYNQHPVC